MNTFPESQHLPQAWVVHEKFPIGSQLRGEAHLSGNAVNKLRNEAGRVAVALAKMESDDLEKRVVFAFIDWSKKT